jgi:hypothetical protein
MGSYTNVFGGSTIYPSDVSYYALTLDTTDIVLSWPLETNASSDIAARIIDVNCTAGGLKIYTPDAQLASTGQTILFNNVGTATFTVVDATGATLCAPSSGTQWQIYLTDNTTEAGTWESVAYGTGVSVTNAAGLAGAGLKAISTRLATTAAITSFNSNYTTGTNDRAQVLMWTGGAGTLTLPLAGNVGNDWYIIVRNSGSGVLTIDCQGTEEIDGAGTKNLAPTESCWVLTNGTDFYTAGYGQNADFVFDYVAINVAGNGTYTLSAAEQNKISYNFYGTLTGNRDIIVPPTIQQYWVDNSTSGAFALTVKTAAGAGYAVPASSRAILYCDGTDVLNAATAGISTPISVANGGTGANSAGAALINLGGNSTGISVFQSGTESAARANLGASIIGDSLFTTPGSIATIGSLNGGSGYVNNNYTNVPLTGGTGAGAQANISVAANTVVTNVTITNTGLGYEAGDVLSASNTNLGGSGSGFNVTVTSITAAAARVTLDVYSTAQTNAAIVAQSVIDGENAIAYAIALG